MDVARRRGAHATLATVAVLASALALSSAATAAPGKPGEPRYSAGAAGAGDPYFPLAGNGGIDVQHYDLDLRYTPPAPAPAPLEGRLTAVATIDLTATQDLDQFNLDLRGLTATSVTVDGKPASFTQPGALAVERPEGSTPQPNELVITPRPKLKEGRTAEVVIEYGGTTKQPVDIEGVPYGWVTTRDGAMVASEPEGSATWFPVSDHPTDKATFTFDVTVPEGLVAVANGDLTGDTTTGGWTTWSWDAPDLMAPYLATATVGNFELAEYTTEAGVPIIDAVDRDIAGTNRTTTVATLALTGEMMKFFEHVYGEYPFIAYGSIVDDDSLGYALETQTRSLFSRRATEGTAAHELAHSWVGNAVSPERWADIWLNEGWATYSEWLWAEHRGGATAQAAFETVMEIPADDEFWDVVVADPGPTGLFLAAIYDRGAATIHALRVKIGDKAFFELTHEWVDRHDDATATTADFEALAEEISGQDLDAFFAAWLHTPEKPTDW
ncbi:M1 family metallopeptidase [Georgenia yuyongxinii]|uniref:Aminopeptidase N n=1 Tax=Georgenia yuyongxinii TaxID=2589797 RepID=A0A5B8C659_9MICO|nr:M1 family metallopeptidase [Georgenia yuyongxinii]QDC26199.1 M1 family metallopeptidase [Georgenia yuyongxinii]